MYGRGNDEPAIGRIVPEDMTFFQDGFFKIKYDPNRGE